MALAGLQQGLPPEELVMKEKQFKYIGKGKSCSNCSGQGKPAVLTRGLRRGLVPTDGGRKRLQHLEASTSVCDISLSDK